MGLKPKRRKIKWVIPDKLQASLAEPAKHAPPANGLKFVKGKFSGVSLKTAPALLISPEKLFYGHKQIVFAGFCAWILGSGDSRISRDAIARETAKIIVAAENSTRLKNVPLRIRFVMYSEAKYEPLFSKIYYPIGGLSALTRAMKNAPDQAKKRKSAEKEIRYLVAMAAVLDFHARNLITPGKLYGKTNIFAAGKVAGILLDDSAGSLVSKRRTKTRSNSSVHEYLNAHRPALAYLYGASLVKFDDDETILDRLLKGRLSYKDVSPETGSSKIIEWFSYSKYFTESVIAIMHGGAKDYPSISVGNSIAPALREFSSDKIEEIKAVFGEKASSVKRP